jgi:hypothetical protein
MRSFFVRRIRNVVALKFGIPAIIVVVSLLAVFMVTATVISAAMAPVEAVKNAVTSFFSFGDSADDDVDLNACLGIEADALQGIVQTVPPQTDLVLARAWIAFRAEEVDRGIEPPRYDSIVTFQISPDAPRPELPAAAGDVPVDVVSTYDLAATAGVLDLIDREMIDASEVLADDLTAALVDNCML